MRDRTLIIHRDPVAMTGVGPPAEAVHDRSDRNRRVLGNALGLEHADQSGEYAELALVRARDVDLPDAMRRAHGPIKSRYRFESK